MRAKIKRLFKRIFKLGGLMLLVFIGMAIGIAIGEESASRRETIVIHSDYPDQFEDDLSISIEQQIGERVEQRIEERIVEQIVIPSIPPIPPIPEIPEIPDIPNIPTTIHIDHSPSFFDVVDGIGTVLASLGLIGLGAVMLVRGRRQPKEKSPESLNK
ncbi:MAG: hypothetical protein GY805_08510 [Chloroflexi bacterium]|nr:hypothetical protein [Chloroflexota bacterium]